MLKNPYIRAITGLSALLVTIALGVSCTEEAPHTDTESRIETDAPTSPDTTVKDTEARPVESETVPETEAVTLPPLTPGEASIEADMTLGEVFHIPPVEKSETVDVPLPGSVTVTVKADSTFFGTESAIDRDTYHWGNILRYTDTRITKFNTDFRVAHLNGERKGQIVTFEGGVLTVYRFVGRGACDPVMTQTLGFEGTLCGAGLFTDDLFTDLLFYVPSVHQFVLGVGSADGFSYRYVGTYPYKDGDMLYTGDFDADGREDLIVLNGLSVSTYRFDGEGFVFNKTTTLPFAEEGQYVLYTVSDMNSDGADDVVGFMKDPAGSTTAKGNEVYGTCSYMSRRDGHFGSYESEGNNKNLNVIHIHSEGIRPLFAAGGDITGDGVDDIALIGSYQDKNRTALFSVVFPEEAPAYDYSSHIIKTDDGYILYTGGLYIDYNTDKYPQTDADHIMAYTSKDGVTWHRNLDAACFFLGNELGVGGGHDLTPGTYENWWAGNTMEPEVLFVDGTYYMYYQCEYYQYDKDGQLMGADRIGVATSTDGIHFERKTDSPALISSDIYSTFTHQEVIYVPDDPDGKCFWMYVRYVHNNREVKRVRIRSADPLCFNMDEDYTECEGLNHIGNQIGYISNYDGKGNRLFLRITMQDYNGDGKGQRWVPSLQFSADGVHWILSELCMAGANLDIPTEAERPNIYFLGFSTVNGTGELAKNADGTGYEFFFVGGTGSSSVAPGIFYGSEGGGYVTLTIQVKESYRT